MIRLDDVAVSFGGIPVLQDVDLTIGEGELCLVIGRTGSGKSTLLRLVTGWDPREAGGSMRGRVDVGGRDTREHRPHDLLDIVGYVSQDPRATFVTHTVETELASGTASRGLPADAVRKRVEETLDLLGIADLRTRALTSLSGGQQQRVAIGAVLIRHPRILVLDEPTSALDPLGAEEVLATVQRLVHDLGLTVVLAEHRLERVVQYADRVVLVPGRGQPVVDGHPSDVLRDSPVAPPVVELGRVAAWHPLPLSVRDARRHAPALRARLADLTSPHPDSSALAPLKRDESAQTNRGGAAVVRLRKVVAGYGASPVLRGITADLHAGEVVALMGRNGAGKSTLLRTLVGLHRPAGGRVEVAGGVPTEPAPRQRHAGLVPQEPADLLRADTAAAECARADRDAEAEAGTTSTLFRLLSPEVPLDRHPRDLSEGQRLTLALATVLATRPQVVLLDEPTRGLDYTAKKRLVEILRDLAGQGHTILLATHDVELVAEAATRVLVLADGELVADGPTADVVVASPAFAPQVAKVLAPQRWLTPTEVAVALSGVTVPR